MYGGSGKIGRGGGGGGAAKRGIHAPPINRSAPAGRLSMGGGPRGRAAAASSSPSTSSSLQVEESFSLVRENPLNFGMAIKLAPDLVEEIKRVEAQGGTARIKFDANANNPGGNVICVGDKSFKFTWSREPGDLCDIYEERRSGEDGNGLLVESGGTWRKLNVERELDESTKNHVKRRSEEAERKYKARKTVILDHQNPVMKNQIKALAAAESNPWRNFKNRKEPPSKKPKSEPPSAGGPPKSLYKSGLTPTTGSKSKISSVSPLPSQPDRHGVPASPIGSGNLAKGHTGLPDVVPFQNMNKTAKSDKEMQSKVPSSTIREKSKHNRNMEAKPADLRSLIISLLMENQSKGMSLKALEKAVGEAMPNSAKQIEPILKQIATFQSPGRYFLKPGVETDNSKKPPCQSGSSPEINHQQSPIPQKFDQLPAQDPSFSMRTAANDEEQGELSSSPLHTVEGVEKIDILNSPEPNDKKNSENSENAVGSSSDSGSESDSDSDSSESGSDDSGSRSRSKSRSPVGSSSDSESDASSSSKQASDEDVDIMTSDDDKEPKPKLPDSDPVSSKSPAPWSNQPDNESVDIGNYEKYDHSSDVIEIEKDSPEANYSIPNKEGKEPFEDIKPSSADHDEQQANQIGDREAYNKPESVVNEKVSKGKSKRRYEDKHSDERSHSKKKSKINNLSQPVINSIFGESPSNSSPERPLQDTEKGSINLMAETIRDSADDHNLQTDYNQITPNRFSVSDPQQLGQRSSEAPWTEAPYGEKRSGKHENLDRGVKSSERSFQTNDGEDGFAGERRQPKSTPEFHHRKPEISGKVKDAFPNSTSYPRFSPKDNNPSTTNRSPLMNGLGAVLRREHSELELGEFREPDENSGPKKQFEKKRYLKPLENKTMDSQSWNADLSRGKSSNKITQDPGKLSPPNSVSGVPDGPSKRKVPEPCADDLMKPHHKSTRPLNQNHQSWGDHNEHNKVAEMSKSRFVESETGQGAIVEAFGDFSRKVSANSTDNATRGVNHHGTKENKKQKRNMVGDSNYGRKDASLPDGHKKKESSSDENSCSYAKYEKEEPELKGPIKDASQYKEYVKEYQEKYDSYCSLNKILESYRDKFSKLGKDLEACKGSDMNRYHDILEQMRSSFRQCGERHKRQKKIYLVLYEELKHLKQMIKDYAASYKKD